MVKEKVIKQVVAPFDSKLVNIEKTVLDGYRFTFMSTGDSSRCYINNIFCGQNDLDIHKVKEGKKYKKGQVIVEWEAYDEGD